MYNKIIDPYNLKIVNINSIRGKNIIKQYLRYILGGMDPNLSSPETSEGVLNFSDFSREDWDLFSREDLDLLRNIDNSDDEHATQSDEQAASSSVPQPLGKRVESLNQILIDQGSSPEKYNLNILRKMFLDIHFKGDNYQTCINLLNTNILKLEQNEYANTYIDVLTSLFGKDAENNLISFEKSVQNLLEIIKNIKNDILQLYYTHIFENQHDKSILKDELEIIFGITLDQNEDMVQYVLTQIQGGFNPGRTTKILGYKILI